MTTNDQLGALATRLAQSCCDRTDPESCAFCCQLVVLLAEGHPVSVKHIARILGRSPAEITAALHQLPSIERDADGNIVGAGLTLRPTRHRFEVNGRWLSTWCALDALMFPSLLQQTAHVESPCLGTGTLVRITVTPQGVEQIEPLEAVVSVVTPAAHPDIRRAFCDDVNFFRSSEVATGWRAAHPSATIVSVADAYHLGRHLAESVFKSVSKPYDEQMR